MKNENAKLTVTMLLWLLAILFCLFSYNLTGNLP
jgi:hypothetical protein